MDSPPSAPTQRRHALRGIVPLLIFTACLTLAAGFFFYRTFRSVRENAFEPGSACEGLPVADSAPYVAGPGLKPALAYRQLDNEQWVRDPELLLPTWRAVDSAELQLVVCIGQQIPLTAPACSDGQDVTYGFELSVRVVMAATGAELDQTTLVTTPPATATCLESAPPAPRLVSDGEINNHLTHLLDVR